MLGNKRTRREMLHISVDREDEDETRSFSSEASLRETHAALLTTTFQDLRCSVDEEGNSRCRTPPSSPIFGVVKRATLEAGTQKIVLPLHKTVRTDASADPAQSDPKA
jgi:hypothetical protein